MFAEVIGDPIAHSRSPAIHRYWLDALRLGGDFRSTRVEPAALADFLAARRADPAWRGCSVTAPHKRAILPLLDRVSPAAARIGAVNCVARAGGALVGHNTDVDGLDEALLPASIRGRPAALIGAGGAARGALHLLVRREASEIRILARDGDAAARLARSAAPARVDIATLGDAAAALAGAAAIVNATPMGAAHGDAPPQALLDGLGAAAPDGFLFDMVYDPVDTALLAVARARGLRCACGLVMLVGQARRAFSLFFGAPPPAGRDDELHELLARNPGFPTRSNAPVPAAARLR